MRYGLDFGSYVASKLNTVYIQLDRDERALRAQRGEETNRHTAAKHKQYYDELLHVVKTTLKEHLQNVDAEKVVVMGRGSAAFNALSMLAFDKDHVLKCALAVSPVTSWRYMGKCCDRRAKCPIAAGDLQL